MVKHPLVFSLLVLSLFVGCDHKRRKEHKVERLHGNRYTYHQDDVDVWWVYQAPDPSSRPWVSASGTVRVPVGGTWVRANPPEKAEIEEEIEISIEETDVGPEGDTDNGCDSDSSDSGDSGSDGGDSGGDSGGGDGGGGD